MTSQTPPGGTSDRPRLTEAQKKENHISSERKRREAIRDGFDRLADIVPGMEGQGRSEAVVLEATLKLIREKIVQRDEIIGKGKEKGLDTTTWELPKETVEACMRQLERQRKEDLQAQQQPN